MTCVTCFPDKVRGAIALIKEIVPNHSAPIVMSSFGKDSMVLLDLVKKANFKLPILSYREPFSPRKYLFANAIIHANDYTVYDYPPLETWFSRRNGSVEIVNLHQGPAGNAPIYLPTGVKPPKMDQPFLCGLSDIYGKPTVSSYSFPWDLALIGHKASDVDPILGPVPINTFFQSGDLSLLFPLKAFTDEDIWRYTIEFNLPINEQRYNRLDNWKEFEDITFNPDYFHACTACMDPESPKEVFCPKVAGMIPNVSQHLRVMKELVPPAYLGLARVEEE
jgi:hypothetical protein